MCEQAEVPHVARWYNTVTNQEKVRSVLAGVSLEMRPTQGGGESRLH